MPASFNQSRPERRALWRQLRRVTRRPRNALLAGTIGVLWRLVGALPLPVGLALGRTLGRAAHRLLGTPRRLARRHVALAFPALDEAAGHRLVRETFLHAGQSFTELTMLDTILRHGRYVVFADGARETLDAALALGRGVLLVSGHCGNWELLAAWVAGIGYPLTGVARVNDVRLHALIMRFREAAGVELIVRDTAQFLSGVRAALARGRIVAMLIDQDTRGAGVFVPFFGRPAHTPPGPALLALRTGAPVLTIFIERRADGGHRVRMERIEVPATRRDRGGIVTLTARLTAAIEAQIRRVPAEWVWWHERWRKQPPPTPGDAARALPSGAR